MDKYITDERTGLNYELIGDYYLIAGDEEPEHVFQRKVVPHIDGFVQPPDHEKQDGERCRDPHGDIEKVPGYNGPGIAPARNRGDLQIVRGDLAALFPYVIAGKQAVVSHIHGGAAEVFKGRV